MDVLRLLDFSFGHAGLLKGDRVMAVLRELIGDCSIEDLDVSFTAVATDMPSGREVWLREGKLFDAIRASIATPLIFTPFKRGGRQLVDGSLVNPLPIAPTLGDTTDLTVAVSLAGRGEAPMQARPKQPVAARNSYHQRISAFIENLHPTRACEGPSIGFAEVALSAMETMQNTIADSSLPRTRRT
jgi:NTE family protein